MDVLFSLSAADWAVVELAVGLALLMIGRPGGFARRAGVWFVICGAVVALLSAVA